MGSVEEGIGNKGSRKETWNGEYTILYTNDALYVCITETWVILLSNVILINSTKIKNNKVHHPKINKNKLVDTMPMSDKIEFKVKTKKRIKMSFFILGKIYHNLSGSPIIVTNVYITKVAK